MTTTEIPIMVRDIDGLAAGHRVTAVCVSGNTAAHGVDGEVIEARRGVVGTALSLPAVDELTPTGCYWRVQARTWTWLIAPRSTTPLTDGSVLVGDPAIQVTSTAPPATWPTGSRLPAGGTAGQVLAKASGDDYDTAWQAGGGGGGAVASVNGKTGAVTLDAADVTADPAGSAATAQAAAISTAATDATTKVATETNRATAAEALKLAKASNLSDLADAATARTNLGLGTAATAAASAFDAAGAATTAQANAISTAASDATAKVATETARATAAEAGRVVASTAGAKLWIGTAAAYTALGTYDATTLYVTT